MSFYCCEKKCFEEPRDQVDGLACFVCKSFSFCICRCETYKAEKLKNMEPDNESSNQSCGESVLFGLCYCKFKAFVYDNIIALQCKCFFRKI